MFMIVEKQETFIPTHRHSLKISGGLWFRGGLYWIWS